MNTEIRTLNRFEDAGLNPEQSKAMVVGIDDLLVKSMATFHHRMDVLEKSMRLQTVSLVATLLLGFTGLIYALVR